MAFYRGSNLLVARTVPRPTRSSRRRGGAAGETAPSDVIAARRRLRLLPLRGRSCWRQWVPSLDNGFPPAAGLPTCSSSVVGAAMVSRPGSRAATEALQDGCGRGAAAVRGGGRCKALRGARLGCGVHRGRSVQGCGCYPHFRTPPRTPGEGRKEEEC